MLEAVLKESGIYMIALAAGIYARRRLDLFHRLILLQLVVFAPVYIGGYLITSYQAARDLPQNNVWIYNLYFPIECAILITAALQLTTSKRIRTTAWLGYAFFFIIFFWQLAANGGIYSFANFGVAAQAFVLVGLYLAILFQKFRTPQFTVKSFPGFAVCLGIALYFGCIVPYFTMMNYLNAHNPEMSATLFYLINGIMSNVRYLGTALSFILFYRQTSKSMALNG